MARNRLPSADVARRRAQAVELRRAGLPWDDIAGRLGYKTASAACQDVRRAIEQTVKAPTRELVAEELDRLDALLGGLWPKARRGDPRSVEVALKVMDQRAKYRRLYGALEDDPAAGARSMLGDLARALHVAAEGLPAEAP